MVDGLADTDPRAASPDELDPDKGPVRTCLVSRVSGSPDGMIRFVCGPDNRVYPDIARKLPGRGVWVSLDKTLVAEAVKRKAFSRGFRKDVVADAGLPDQVEKLLLDRAMAALSMCRKAGQAVTGFTKVSSTLNGGLVIALIHAVEAAEDGVRKVAQVANRVAREYDPGAIEIKSELPVIDSLTSDQLDLALGGVNVIHAALLSGGASRNFVERLSDWLVYTGRPRVKKFNLAPKPTEFLADDDVEDDEDDDDLDD